MTTSTASSFNSVLLVLLLLAAVAVAVHLRRVAPSDEEDPLFHPF